MRVFVVFCLIAVAAAQYDYAPQDDQGGSVGGGSVGGGSVGAAQLSQPIHQASEFNKEFYTYTAPEAEFDDGNANDAISAAVKKSLRVVFIKGPDNSGLENAALQLAKSASDDRTAIYVLSKQADVSNLANQLQALKSSSQNKPEVHFVKYRTQSDAENAQRTIQSQYDSLPGPSINSNGGAAPVLDFASKAAPIVAPIQSGGGSYNSPNTGYLPPGKRF